MKTSGEFVILCSNRWLRIEVTARQKSGVFPRCRHASSQLQLHKQAWNDLDSKGKDQFSDFAFDQSKQVLGGTFAAQIARF